MTNQQDETVDELLLPVMRAARARIDTPDKWCQDAAARDKNGRPTGSTFPDACQFCVEGAVRAALHARGLESRYQLMLAINEAFCEAAVEAHLPWIADGNCIANAFNDHEDATHAGILGALDTAIAKVASHV